MLTRRDSDVSEARMRERRSQQDDDVRRYRQSFWANKIEKERNRRYLIYDLIATEFRRVHKRVSYTDSIRETILNESSRAHQALYGCCHVLFVLNHGAFPWLGRRRDGLGTLPGIIQCWDTQEGKLKVKFNDQHYEFIKPEHLDIVEGDADEWNWNTKYTVSFYFRTWRRKDSKFQFDLNKSCVEELKSIRSASAEAVLKMKDRISTSNCFNAKQEEERIEVAATADRMRLAFESKQQSEQTLQIEYCLHGFPISHQDWSSVEQFVKLFWDEYMEQEGDGISLEQCFQAAIDVTSTPFCKVWSDKKYMKAAISVLLHNGTRDIRIGYLSNARANAAITSFFEQWQALRSNSQYDWNWNVIHELHHADEHTLVSYFHHRIPCSCLADKHKEVKSMKKMGICCNPRCSLPDRKLERSAMESCEQCRLVHYCSRHCQKKDWKRHKDACLHSVSPELNLMLAKYEQAKSTYHDLHGLLTRVQEQYHNRLQEQYHELQTAVSTDDMIDRPTENEAGATVTAAETHQPRGIEESEAEMKRLNNDYTVALARRREAVRALQFLMMPRVDYSKAMNEFYMAEDIRGRLKCLLGLPKVDYYSKTNSEARP